MCALFIRPTSEYQADHLVSKFKGPRHLGLEEFTFMCHFLGFKNPVILRYDVGGLCPHRFIIVDNDDKAGRHFEIVGHNGLYEKEDAWRQKYIEHLISQYVPEKGRDELRDLTEALKFAKEETERLTAKIAKAEEEWQTEFLRLSNRLDTIERNLLV
jgi:hypothetical protein